MRPLALGAVILLTACSPQPAEGPASGAPTLMKIPASHPAPPPLRSNTDMAEDILDLAFELESGRPIPVLSRFEGPIHVRVAGPAPATLGPDLDALLGRLRAEGGLNVSLSTGPAQITVEAVAKADLARAVPDAACFVVPGASSWAEFLARRGTPALDWTRLAVRTEAAVFIPADAAPEEIRDCLHEELAQAMGPLDDLTRLPDSVFNDDNIHSTLTGFDMLTLRALNDPALASGMTRADVADRLPAILARLNPAGEQVARRGDPVSPAWVASIEAALAEGRPAPERRRAAEAAVTMARAGGWPEGREGFALYALGRLSTDDPHAALAAFQAARTAFGRSPLTDIHGAHVDVQLAAFALASGDMAEVLRLAADGAPVAEAHGNASLLATLLMFRAEALDATGQPAAARASRLDALAWARYGFGGAAAVQARLAEVEALNPWRLAGGQG